MSSLLATLDTRTKEELIDTCANLLRINKRLSTQTHPEWIRVTDVLPDNEREVLVSINGTRYVASYLETGWTTISEDLHAVYLEDVTHWIELPEPPSEEL